MAVSYTHLDVYKRQTYDTIKYVVFYPAGETKIDSAKQTEILKNLSEVRGKVIAVQASAFASIEGTSSENQVLAKKRLMYFLTLTKPKLNKGKYKTRLLTGENWNVFYRQIRGTHLSHLAQLSKEEVRDYINKNKSDSNVIRILNDQRYIEFSLIFSVEHKDPVSYTHLELKDNAS